MARALPRGTVTFLFTNIVDTARSWEDAPIDTAQAFRAHDDIVRGAIERHGGYVFGSEGGGYSAAFSTAADAASAAIESQELLRDEAVVSFTVRMALHTGDAVERDRNYVGADVNRASRLMTSGAEVVFNTIVPPGLTPFLEQLHHAGFTARGGHIVCTYFDENFLNLVPADQVDGLYGCLDYYRGVDDPFSIELLRRYEQRFPGSALFTAGSACTGTYRALKLWEAAVTEAGSLHQDDVIAALDHARIAQGPGGPAEMVPGQHHVRMNMYIARSEGGTFKVVENLGHIDPKECEVGRG